MVKCPLTALHFKCSQLQLFGFEWERFQLCYLSTGLIFRLFHLSVIRYMELGSFPNFHRACLSLSSPPADCTRAEVRVTRTGVWSVVTLHWAVVSGPGILMGSPDRGEGITRAGACTGGQCGQMVTLHWAVVSGGHLVTRLCKHHTA